MGPSLSHQNITSAIRFAVVPAGHHCHHIAPRVPWSSRRRLIRPLSPSTSRQSPSSTTRLRPANGCASAKAHARPRRQDTLPHERVRRAFESCLSGRSRVSLCAAESRTRAGTEHGPRPTRARLRSGKGARRWRGIPDMAMAVPASACIPHMSSMSSRLHSLRTQRSPARLSKKAGRKRLQGTPVYLSGPDVSKIQNTGIAHSQSKSRPN